VSVTEHFLDLSQVLMDQRKLRLDGLSVLSLLALDGSGSGGDDLDLSLEGLSLIFNLLEFLSSEA